jgi:hypothetical protein
LKWGLRSFVATDLLESIHVSVSSLLRASTGLLGEVRTFITGNVIFDRPTPTNLEDVEFFWIFLGVDVAHVELFVRVNPIWDGEKLSVSQALFADLDAIEIITACIKYCMKWVDFSETRWTKVGESGRCFLRSLCVGIEPIVKLAEGNSAVINWHLNGFKKATSDVRLYLALAAAAARPSEALLLEMMEDDRLLIHADKYWEVLEDELKYITGAPLSLWQTIAGVLQVSAQDLRRWAVDATVISIGYIWMDIWSHFAQAPWKYAIGDVRRNVEDLKVAPPAAERTSSKLQLLAQGGFEHEVVKGLELLKEAAMTTILVEQAHASAAKLIRRHQQLGMDVMCARSTVHNARSLFHPSKFEQQEQKLFRMLDNLDKTMLAASKHGAREGYLKLIIHHWKEVSGSAGLSHFAIRQACFRHHHDSFKKLGPEELTALHKKAAADKRVKVNNALVERQHVQAQLELLHRRHFESQAAGSLNQMSGGRFDDTDFRSFAESWEKYTAKDIKGKLLPPPEHPSAAVEALLQDKMRLIKEALPATPVAAWIIAVIVNRDLFANVGFYSDSDDMPRVIYKFVVATQSPRRAIFLECRRRDHIVPAIASLRPGEMPDPSWRRHHYDYLPLKFFDNRTLPIVAADSIVVATELFYRDVGVHHVGAHIGFDSFVRFHPPHSSAEPRVRAARTGRIRVTAEILEKLKQEFPWMSAADIEAMVSEVRPNHGERGGGARGGPAAPGVPAEMLPEDVAAAVAAELADIRAELAGVEADVCYFSTRVLGGQWTAANRGVAADAVGMFSRGLATQRWCLATEWPRQRSYYFTKYSMLGAKQLAEEICRRGNYFMSCWVNAGQPRPFIFFAAAECYPEDFEWIEWLSEQPIESDAFAAGVHIRGLIPLDVPL